MKPVVLPACMCCGIAHGSWCNRRPPTHEAAACIPSVQQAGGRIHSRMHPTPHLPGTHSRYKMATVKTFIASTWLPVLLVGVHVHGVLQDGGQAAAPWLC